jgi:hypothetical protein
VAAARQPDLGPLPCRIGLAATGAQTQTVGIDPHVFDLERHQLGAAQCAGEAEQEKRPIMPAAGGTVTSGQQLRNRTSESAAAFCGGRPWRRNNPCNGPWMAPCAQFHGRSL